jgi:FHA domain
MFLPSYWGSVTRLEWGLTDVPYPAPPFAAAAWVVPALVLAAGFLETAESLLAQGIAAIETGYRQQPVLMLVLSVLLILPTVAVISLVYHKSVRRNARRQALQAAQRRAEAGGQWPPQTLPTTGLQAWPSQAWLTIEGKGYGTMPLAGHTVRIGRHQDNDIRLADSSVHRYHAVIERTPEEAFVITDLSGKEGNGVRINGARTAQARLTDGDLIELGRMKLKFECAPA